MRNDAGAAGLPLTLTKPLGIGVLNSRHKATGEVFPQAVAAMTDAEPGRRARPRSPPGRVCATDVTGFGLLGHLHKLARASGVTAVVDAAAVPYLDGARRRAAPPGTSAAAPGATSTGCGRTPTPAAWPRTSCCCSPTRRPPAGCWSPARCRAIRWSASCVPARGDGVTRRPVTLTASIGRAAGPCRLGRGLVGAAAAVVPLRHDGVLRVLGRGHAALEDAEPGGQRRGQQRQRRTARTPPGCAARARAPTTPARSAPGRRAAAGRRGPSRYGSLSRPLPVSTRWAPYSSSAAPSDRQPARRTGLRRAARRSARRRRRWPARCRRRRTAVPGTPRASSASRCRRAAPPCTWPGPARRAAAPYCPAVPTGGSTLRASPSTPRSGSSGAASATAATPAAAPNALRIQVPIDIGEVGLATRSMCGTAPAGPGR